jgi:HEAT repeat protein
MALVRALKDSTFHVRDAAANALRAIKPSDPAVLHALVLGLQDRDSSVRSRAASLLGEAKSTDPAVLQALVRALNDLAPGVRDEVGSALQAIKPTDPAVVNALAAEMCSGEHFSTAQAVAGILSQSAQSAELPREVRRQLAAYQETGRCQ